MMNYSYIASSVSKGVPKVSLMTAMLWHLQCL